MAYTALGKRDTDIKKISAIFAKTVISHKENLSFPTFHYQNIQLTNLFHINPHNLSLTTFLTLEIMLSLCKINFSVEYCVK